MWIAVESAGGTGKEFVEIVDVVDTEKDAILAILKLIQKGYEEDLETYLYCETNPYDVAERKRILNLIMLLEGAENKTLDEVKEIFYQDFDGCCWGDNNEPIYGWVEVK